jgi:hypothetical protein
MGAQRIRLVKYDGYFMLDPALRALLPNLTDDNHSVTTGKDNAYNCIAWAAGDTVNWWWPQGPYYWPPNVPRNLTMDAFCKAFEAQGYVRCADGSVEAGFEKIAIFGKQNAAGDIIPTHAARQMPDGNWTSKLGVHEDIEHDKVDGVSCPSYGAAIIFLRCQAL